MTTEQETAPEADDTTDSGTPAQTVRVPNVSPGAKSGLDHIVIGSDALAPPEDDGDADAEPEEEPDTDPVPDGDADAILAWVEAAEDQDTAKARADKAWTNLTASGPSPEYEADLAGRLRTAVYGSAPDPATDLPPADPGDDGLEVAPDSPVPGQVVVTAGVPGEAENADTGAVTPAGEPLPDADADTEDGGPAGS